MHEQRVEQVRESLSCHCALRPLQFRISFALTFSLSSCFAKRVQERVAVRIKDVYKSPAGFARPLLCFSDDIRHVSPLAVGTPNVNEPSRTPMLDFANVIVSRRILSTEERIEVDSDDLTLRLLLLLPIFQ